MLTWDTKSPFSILQNQNNLQSTFTVDLNNYEAWGASADMTGKKHQSLECSPKHHNPCWWVLSKSHLPLQCWCRAEKTNCRVPVSSPGRAVTPPVSGRLKADCGLETAAEGRSSMSLARWAAWPFPRSSSSHRSTESFPCPGQCCCSCGLPLLIPHSSLCLCCQIDDV